MNMNEIISYIVTYGPMIIAAAAAAAAVFPQGKPGSTWGRIRAIIDTLALNVGNATNKPKV
jgi:hypothetical protein